MTWEILMDLNLVNKGEEEDVQSGEENVPNTLRDAAIVYPKHMLLHPPFTHSEVDRNTVLRGNVESLVLGQVARLDLAAAFNLAGTLTTMPDSPAGVLSDRVCQHNLVTNSNAQGQRKGEPLKEEQRSRKTTTQRQLSSYKHMLLRIRTSYFPALVHLWCVCVLCCWQHECAVPWQSSTECWAVARATGILRDAAAQTVRCRTCRRFLTSLQEVRHCRIKLGLKFEQTFMLAFIKHKSKGRLQESATPNISMDPYLSVT